MAKSDIYDAELDLGWGSSRSFLRSFGAILLAEEFLQAMRLLALRRAPPQLA